MPQAGDVGHDEIGEPLVVVHDRRQEAELFFQRLIVLAGLGVQTRHLHALDRQQDALVHLLVFIDFGKPDFNTPQSTERRRE